MSHRIIEYLVPAKISLPTIYKDIKSKFPYHSENTIRLERSYQDSFDCRLYKNGYEYYVEKYPDQTNLFIHPVNAINEVNILSVHEMPVFAQDFKSVIFHRVINPVLDIRALMPHVVLSIKRYAFALVDEENKIYAQIQLDEVVLDKPDCKQESIGRFVRILPVKGYEASTNKITAYLDDDLKLDRSDETFLTRALKITKSDYCPLMTFPHHGLKTEMRTDEAVKAILLSEMEIIELNEEGLIKDIDSEFLHDYRVAIRRTRSLLKQVKGVFLKRILDRYNEAFSWLGRLTGPLRDIHVYLLKFDSYKQQLPHDMKHHLEPLRDFLFKHEKIEHARLAHEIAKKRYVNLKLNWRKFLEQPLPDKVHLPNATRIVKQVADEAIWNAFQKTISYGKKIKDDSPDEKLHRMRINCKKLRYLLEFFIDLYPPKQMSGIIKSLKKFQNMLGDFQDLSVQVVTLRAFESQMKEEGMLTEQTLDAMEYLVTYLDEVKKDIRAHYVESYAILSSEKIERRFSELFNTVTQES